VSTAALEDDAPRRRDDLVLVTTPAMRARRHPFAIAALWAWQTAMALLVAWPARGLVQAAYGNDPRGDAALWAPGGHALLDWLWRDAHGLRSVVGSAEIALGAAAVLGLVPMAAVMIAIAHTRRERLEGRWSAAVVEIAAGALRAFPAMALLLVVVTIAQGVVVATGLALASAVESAARVGMGEARAQQLEGVVAIASFAAVSVLGVVHDLARAAVVRFRVRGFRALLLGARTFRLAPLTLWWSWAWRAAAALAPILVGAALASRAGGRGGFVLLVLAAVHQAVVVARAALHASWWAKALRSVDASLRRAIA